MSSDGRHMPITWQEGSLVDVEGISPMVSRLLGILEEPDVSDVEGLCIQESSEIEDNSA